MCEYKCCNFCYCHYKICKYCNKKGLLYFTGKEEEKICPKCCGIMRAKITRSNNYIRENYIHEIPDYLK
jgi:hypothetical protein